MMTAHQYVEVRAGGFYVAGTRISLDSIVYAFRSGNTPECIHQSFPSLTLEQVYGAIAFYLAHQAEVDRNILEGEAEFDLAVPPLSQSNPELSDRLRRAREKLNRSS
jgi:uncharacterized protein (DUF433 family)